MLGIGSTELLVIAAIALVVIGPERLPKVMRTLGQYYGQLRRAADDLRRAFVMEADRQDAEERYRQLRERRQRELEARQKVEAEAAAKAQAEAPAAPAEHALEENTEPFGGKPGEAEVTEAMDPVPNDIPPDAPHPRLARPAGTGGAP